MEEPQLLDETISDWAFIEEGSEVDEANQVDEELAPKISTIVLDDHVARQFERIKERLNTNTPLTSSSEEDIADNLLAYATEDSSTECAAQLLAQFVGTKLQHTTTMHLIADTLADLYLTAPTAQVRSHLVATVTQIVVAMPILAQQQTYRNSQLARVLVESLATKLTAGHLSEKNVEGAVHIIKTLMRYYHDVFKSSSRECVRKMHFIGEYFCTGIELGKGAFAVVYLGRNTKTAEIVAIKQMDWEKLTKDSPKLAQYLENEISIMKHTSPRILHLFDDQRDADGKHLTLILEYCSGGSLEDYLNKHLVLSQELVLHWLGELAEGLQFLRSINVVHRDLKPANILLMEGHPLFHLKIGDFGLARFLNPGELAATFVGSPLYMAPEVISRRNTYTDKADLWSVGIILYQMLTGRLPFTGRDLTELTFNVHLRPVTWPKSPEVPQQLKDLVGQLLQKDPAKRIAWDDFFNHPCININMKKKEQEEVAVEATPKSGFSDVETSVIISEKKMIEIEGDDDEESEEVQIEFNSVMIVNKGNEKEKAAEGSKESEIEKLKAEIGALRAKAIEDAARIKSLEDTVQQQKRELSVLEKALEDVVAQDEGLTNSMYTYSSKQ